MSKNTFIAAIIALTMVLSMAAGTQIVKLAAADSNVTQTLIIYNPTQNATYINNMQISFTSTLYDDGWFIIDNGSMHYVRTFGIDSQNITYFDSPIVLFSNLNLGNGTTHHITIGVSSTQFDGNKITTVNVSSAPILFTAVIIPQTFQITSPQNATYNTSDITVNVTLNDQSSFQLVPPMVEYILDNRSGDYRSSFGYSIEHLTGLTNGSHSVTVNAFGKNETIFFTVNAQPTPSPSPNSSSSPITSASVPEFPTWIALPIFSAAAVAVFLAKRRKRAA